MMNKKLNFEKILRTGIYITLISIGLFILCDKISIKLLKKGKSEAEKAFSLQDVRKPYPYIMFKGAPFAKAWKHHSPKSGITDNILNELGYPGNPPPMPIAGR